MRSNATASTVSRKSSKSSVVIDDDQEVDSTNAAAQTITLLSDTDPVGSLSNTQIQRERPKRVKEVSKPRQAALAEKKRRDELDAKDADYNDDDDDDDDDTKPRKRRRSKKKKQQEEPQAGDGDDDDDKVDEADAKPKKTMVASYIAPPEPSRFTMTRNKEKADDESDSCLLLRRIGFGFNYDIGYLRVTSIRKKGNKSAIGNKGDKILHNDMKA